MVLSDENMGGGEISVGKDQFGALNLRCAFFN